MAQERKNRNEQGLQRRSEPGVDFWDPFSTMRRFNEEMDRWFGDFGLGRRSGRQGAGNMWIPQIETFQKGDQFVVRADLPGLKKEDINLELVQDSLVIQGERRDEHEEKEEGFYRSERSYGTFYRVVPLPEGAIAETARADFNNGVLEVTVQAPPREVSGRRKVEIGSGARSQEGAKTK